MNHSLLNSLFLLLLLLIHHSLSLTSKNQFTIEVIPFSTPKSHISTSNKDDDNNSISNHPDYDCDISTDGPICANSGERVILPSSNPDNLLFNINFDQKMPLDSSDNNLHPKGFVLPGPTFTGHGHSALFKEGNFLQIEHDKKFNLESFSLTFWIFMYEDFMSNSIEVQFCPIFQKGDDTQEGERPFKILYDREDKHLRVLFSTLENEEGEIFATFSKLLPQRWYNIALIKSQNGDVKLYVNGILDKEITLKKDVVFNKTPFFIGNSPATRESCDFPFILDKIRMYTTELPIEKIQAEAAPTLGGVAPYFVKFGCKDCEIGEIESICPDEDYNLCTGIDLHAGGYQIARNLGWLNWDTYIWTRSALDNKKDFKNLKGLGLCCKDMSL